MDAQQIVHPLAFDGSVLTTGKGETCILGAEDFINEVERRMPTYNLTDATVMPHVLGSFRGEAARWWLKDFSVCNPADRVRLVTGSWREFKKFFKRRFHCKEPISGVDWASTRSQRQGETAASYCSRVVTTMHELHEVSIDDRITLANYGPSAAVAGHIAGIDGAAIRQAVTENITDRMTRACSASIQSVLNQMAVHQVVDGLLDNQLRMKAIEIAITKPEWFDFCHRLNQTQMTLADQRKKQGGHHRGVAATGNSDGEEDDTTVSALSRPSSSATGRPPTAQRDDQGRCSWCKKGKHDKKTCVARKKYFADKSNKKAADRPATAAAQGEQAASAIGPYLQTAAASGNAKGAW